MILANHIDGAKEGGLNFYHIITDWPDFLIHQRSDSFKLSKIEQLPRCICLW